jgi:hypothetical protein
MKYVTKMRTPGREMNQLQGLHLHTEQHKHRINAQTSMPHLGFEPTIPVFERAKKANALDSAATVISISASLPVQ